MSGEVLVWPGFLEIPLRSGYDYSPTDRRAKAEMEMGSRYRVIFDTDETVLHCDFSLARNQLAFFEAFEKHLLKQGSVWFDMPLDVAGIVETHSVRLKERPQVGNFMAGYAVVSMTLDVRERRTMSETATWLIYQYGLEIFNNMNRLHEILHVHAPGMTIVPNPLSSL